MKENTIEKNIGKRVLAGIIDYGIIFSFAIIFTIKFGEKTSAVSYELNGFPVIFPVLFWGIMTIGVESVFGATFGNYLVGLKPIPLNGNEKSITFIQSLKRHLLDVIDMSMFGIVGIILINNTEKKQRLGDLWAKTIVVKK